MEKIKPFLKEVGIYILIIVIVLVFKTFVISPIRVNGTSMYPTLHHKDIMVLDKISYRFSPIKRFDIVVIKYDGEYLIKRVVALPGEHIEYRNNHLYIDGKKIEEDFEHEDTEDFSLDWIEQSKVPEDTYFVVGDNRINSKDSRIIGTIARDDIVGKSSLTLFPFSRMGKKE